MESPQFKTAVLRSWNERGFGFAHELTDRFPVQRYYLHASQIESGPCPPPIGSIVRFEVGPPRKKGELPTALRALIIEPPEASGSVAVQS